MRVVATCVALVVGGCNLTIGEGSGEPAIDGGAGAADGGADGGGGAGADAGAVGPDAWAGPVTLVFGETPGADVGGVTADAYLSSASSGTNHGGAETLRIDEDPLEVMILRFDLAALPPGVTVTAAELSFSTGADPLEGGTVDVYQLLEEWADAKATWVQRTNTKDWATAGASGAARAASASGSAAPAAASTRYAVTLPTALVQAWVDQPDGNHGVVVVPVGTAGAGVDIASSESATADARPTLTVTASP